MEKDIVHRAIDNLHSVSGIVGDANQNDLIIDNTGDYDGSMRLMYRSHMVKLSHESVGVKVLEFEVRKLVFDNDVLFNRMKLSRVFC